MLAVLPVGLVTLFLAHQLNVWVDEAYSLQTTGAGLAHALRQAIHFELQSPGYFVALGAWRLPGGSFFWARLFSVLCLLCTLPVVARLARIHLPDLWVVLPLGLHSWSVYAAIELRAYALVVLLSALLMWLFHLGYRQQQPSTRAQLAYLLIAVIAVYVQYYVGFMLVAHGAVLLAHRQWPALVRYLLGMAAVAVALIPLAWVVPAQVGGYAFAYERPDWPLAFKSLYWRLGDYLLPMTAEALQPVKVWGQRALALGLLACAVIARRRLLRSGLLSLAAAVGVMLLLTLPMLKAWGAELVGARHTIYLLGPLVLLALSVAHAALGPRAAAALSLVIMLASATSVVDRYSGLAKEGDWIRVARHIQASERAGQPVLVFRAQSALALRVHYAGKNRLVPLPAPSNLVTWDPGAEALTDEAQIDRALATLPGGKADEYWLVTDAGYRYMSIHYNHDLLERYVQRRFTVQGRAKSFKGSSVRLLRRRPGGEG